MILLLLLLLSFMNYLYILEINPLLIPSFANIFFSFCGLSFHFFFIVSFAMQKLLSLIRSHWFIFVIFITLGGGSKKILLQFMSKCVLPLFFSSTFIQSGLIFRSLIHFKFIFVYDVRECSNFILVHVAIWFSQHQLLKRLSFLLCIFLPPLSQIN